MTVDHSPYLEPTEFLDWQQDSVRDFVSSAIRGACGDTEKAMEARRRATQLNPQYA